MLLNILSGIQAYFQSFHLISKLKLWSFFIIPIIISAVFAILIGIFVYSFSDNLGYYIAKLWVWDWGKTVFTTIGNVLGGLIILIFGLILYKHIVMALSAPFMSPVSERIEAYLMGQTITKRQTTFTQQLIRGIKINVRNLGMEIGISIPILLLSLIPIIGLFTTLLLFIVQAYYAGFGNMDYTLERHFNFKESIAFVKNNRGIAIGNGIVFILFLFIPVIGVLLVLPLSVTAASFKTIQVIHSKSLKN